MTQFSKNYVVISPVRDEEAYLRFTIESMLAQTVRPVEWIIVNDGSTDNTSSSQRPRTTRPSTSTTVHHSDDHGSGDGSSKHDDD